MNLCYLSHAAKSLHVQSDIDVFLAPFCDLFFFCYTSNCFWGAHARNSGTRNEFGASMRPYSGVNFELQLLSHVPSETPIGEAEMFAGDI